MSELPEVTDSVEFERGGFWQRALAVLIDMIAVCLVLEAVALALFPVSDGRVQLVSGFALQKCQGLLAPPDGVSLPAGFSPTSILDCQRSVFGLPISRTLLASRSIRDGAITRTSQFAHALDRNGQPVRSWPLDNLILPLLIALRLWLDRGQGSPGRRICRTRLSSSSNAEMRRGAMMKRYFAQSLPLLPMLLWAAYGASAPPAQQLSDTPWLLIALIVAGVPSLIAAFEALSAVVGRKDAYYDRIAGTCVVRLDKSKAPIPAQIEPAGSDNGDSAAGPEALAAAGSATGPRNYFRRHWRGDLSLPVSYWLNGFLVSVVFGIGFVVVKHLSSGSDEARPLLWLVSLIAAWVIVLLLTIWQAVGVWRSATRYQQRKTPIWGGVAKISTVFGIVRLAITLATTGLPQIAGIYEIVSGDAEVGAHEFHVLANGQLLEFSGGITFGVAQEFERFLNAMSGVKAVRLNSPGGRTEEAQRKPDKIKSRGLSTYVIKDCLSACTVVFLGGKERVIVPAARLGFHQPSFRGMTATDRKNAIVTELQRLQRLGLSKEFSERANGAPPNAMWYPDQAELIRERVVTRVVQPAKPAAPKAAPPASGSGPAANEKPVAAAPSGNGSPPADVPRADDSAAPMPRLESGRAVLPADLVKRLVTQPRKPAPEAASSAGQLFGTTAVTPAPPKQQ